MILSNFKINDKFKVIIFDAFKHYHYFNKKNRAKNPIILIIFKDFYFSEIVFKEFKPVP